MTRTIHRIPKGVGASALANIVVAFLLAPTVVASGQDEYRPPPQVQRRLQEIASLRRQNREIFDAVKPYCQPAVSFRTRAHVPGRFVMPKPFGLEVLHPDYRLVVEKHAELYAQLKRATDPYWRRVVECDDRTCVESERDELHARIKEIRELAEVLHAPTENAMLLAAAGHWQQSSGRSFARLDPKYLLAWEEALLDPDVSWWMRAWLLDVVVSFQDAASTPTLGEFLRAVLRAQGAADRVHRDPTGTIAYEVEHELLSNRRSPESARELSETIRYLDREKQKEHLRRIGGAMEEVPEWRNLLDQMETDPEMAPHARRLREAAAFYRENKPPDTEDSDSR